MLMTCCAYSYTQYGLHTQYMLLTHANDLLCLQLHTVQSRFFAPVNFHLSDPRTLFKLLSLFYSRQCVCSPSSDMEDLRLQLFSLVAQS